MCYFPGCNAEPYATARLPGGRRAGFCANHFEQFLQEHAGRWRVRPEAACVSCGIMPAVCGPASYPGDAQLWRVASWCRDCDEQKEKKPARLYRVFYARNWPDALLDKNSSANWPSDYDYTGQFRATGLEDLWRLLNADKRPSAAHCRSMCVGDVAVQVRKDGRNGIRYICRMLGWEKLAGAKPRSF